MKRYAIQTTEAGLKFVGEDPAGPFTDRTDAERELFDTVKRQDMTPEAWRSLQHLLEE